MNEEREHGTQPLDGMMSAWVLVLGNHDLVDASTEQLTHKQVQRARAGRVLNLHMMQKVARSLNIAVWYRLKREEREVYFEYLHKHLHSPSPTMLKRLTDVLGDGLLPSGQGNA